MKNKITCRPCREQNNWEIENQYGVTLEKHYSTREACVQEGKRLAKESNCTLDVCDDKDCCK